MLTTANVRRGICLTNTLAGASWFTTGRILRWSFSLSPGFMRTVAVLEYLPKEPFTVWVPLSSHVLPVPGFFFSTRFPSTQIKALGGDTVMVNLPATFTCVFSSMGLKTGWSSPILGGNLKLGSWRSAFPNSLITLSSNGSNPHFEHPR